MEAFSTNLPANLFPVFCAPARKTHISARRHLRVSMLQNDGNTTNEKYLRTRIPGKTIAEPPQSKNPVYLNYFSEVFLHDPALRRSLSKGRTRARGGELERAGEDRSARGRRKKTRRRGSDSTGRWNRQERARDDRRKKKIIRAHNPRYDCFLKRVLRTTETS